MQSSPAAEAGRSTLPGLVGGAGPVRTAAELPDRRYFRIGEVATLLGVKPYVLRYWETEFPQVRPQKSRSGQRLYRRREVEVLLDIRHLLYEQQFTIAGARKALREIDEARLGGRSPTELEPLPVLDAVAALSAGTAVGHLSRPPPAEVDIPSASPPPPAAPVAVAVLHHAASSPPHSVGLPSLTPQRAEQLSLALAQVDHALLDEIRDGIRDLLDLCRSE